MNDKRRVLVWTLILSTVGELITLAMRFGTGITGQQFNQTAPLILQIHHMFWSIPLLCIAAATRSRPRTFDWLVALSIACVLSDLSHHFIVLPILTGATGWHWP